MAKKKNIVAKTKGSGTFLLAAIMVIGWLLAVYTVLADDAEGSQNAMIAAARQHLEDKLYVRAAAQYRTALAEYSTDNNLRYESELLEIYREAGMEDEYLSLIDDRIDAGTASLEEYIARGEAYIEKGRLELAIPMLQQGMKVYQDEGLTALYESICYAYKPSSTTFTQVQVPSEDWYIPAFDGERWGYIGTDGRTRLDFLYEEATPFSGKYAVVKLDGVYTLIDKDGYWNAVDKNALDKVAALSGSRIVGVKDGRYGIYTNTFQLLGKETYDGAYLNDNGLIVVKKDDRWAILDAGLQPITDYVFTDVAVNSRGQVFSGNFGVVADEKGYYLINGKGEPYFEARFPEARGMEEGLFAVADDSGRWGFANEKAELVVECRYEDAYSFSNRLAAVKYAGKWGYINKYDSMVIEAEFSSALPFLGGNSLVTDSMGNYRILTLKYYSLF